MKTTIKCTLIIFLITSFFIAMSCAKQKAEWKGTVEEVNEVTIVKNPKEPIYSEDVFSLEEELSIGEAEGREEYMFSQIRGLAVDEQEKIYVLDLKEAHIKVFGKNGDYLRTIGRKGQGPGELGIPIYIWITNQKEIMVEDPSNRRLVFYSLEGEFLRNISTAKNLVVGAKTDPLGNIIGIVYIREEENPRYEIRIFDSELNYLHTLISTPSQNIARDGYNPFFPIWRWDVNKSNKIVCGYPEKYEIKIFDAEGKVIRKIMRDYDPVKITVEEVEKEKKEVSSSMKLSIPKYHSAYYRLIVDDDDRIFVRTWERVNDGEVYYYDIFDSEGKYICKIPLKNRPFVIKKNMFYTIEDNEEGYQVVKRYKVTWKM